MIKFIEVINETNFNPRMERTAIPQFSLGELWINEDSVVKIRNATGYKQLLRDGLMGEELNAEHNFTSITLNNCGVMETHVVVGAPDIVAGRLNRDSRTLLKG
jgi:hypothetical protein|tara:strand:+ start:679 stop:987 length:309 start_codon:yes stop_codon:yes gene_type:complete